MKIYHGSNQKVATPSILIGRKNLDFGCGFYATSDFDQVKVSQPINYTYFTEVQDF